jgi:hypothetical protein
MRDIVYLFFTVFIFSCSSSSRDDTEVNPYNFYRVISKIEYDSQSWTGFKSSKFIVEDDDENLRLKIALPHVSQEKYVEPSEFRNLIERFENDFKTLTISISKIEAEEGKQTLVYMKEFRGGLNHKKMWFNEGTGGFYLLEMGEITLCKGSYMFQVNYPSSSSVKDLQKLVFLIGRNHDGFYM